MSEHVDSWQGIIERMRAFCEGHELFIADADGNKPFTHGQPDLNELRKLPQYPLMHVQCTGRSWGRDSKFRTFDIEVMFAERPFMRGQDVESKQENISEALSDTGRLCEDLIATIANGSAPFDYKVFRFEGDPTATPFIEEEENALTGHVLQMTLALPYNWSACDVPGTFNMNTGSSGGGNNTTPAYLANIAVSGQDTVESTQAGDTFSFAGSGVTITTDPVTKVITFTVSGGGDVVGPASATNNAIALFDGTTGKLIKDSATTIAQVLASAGDVDGPASATNNNLAAFDGATGKLIKDSGVEISSLGDVDGPASAVDERIARFNGVTGKLLEDSGYTIADVLSLPFAEAAGTVNAMTADFTPNLVLTNGLVICVRASGANTSANVALAVDGGTSRAILKRGDMDLVAGDIPNADYFMLLAYHDEATPHWEILNAAQSTVIRKEYADAATLTGSTSETIMKTIAFAANEVKAGDILHIVWRYRKTGTAGNHTPRLRIGTSGLSSALAASGSVTASNLYQQLSRRIVVKSSTSLEMLNASQAIVDDMVQNAAAVTTLTVDVTQAWNIYITSQLTNGADTVVLSGYDILTR